MRRAGLASFLSAGITFAAFALAAHANENGVRGLAHEARVGMNDSIDSKVGEEFSIVLDGVPTAGFVWRLAHPLAKSGLVEELGEQWEPGDGHIGGTARRRFSFRALAEGEIALRFRYGRPWEETAREERDVLVRIHP